MRIQYYFNLDDSHVYSRVGSEVAIPILDYEGMKPENNYQMNYYLEKYSMLSVCSDLARCVGTRKIPVHMKNLHRKFWGMKELKEK